MVKGFSEKRHIASRPMLTKTMVAAVTTTRGEVAAVAFSA
jgi:hypothetical protein